MARGSHRLTSLRQSKPRPASFLSPKMLGTLRLFIPDAHAPIIKKIESAEYVILSLGRWPAEEHAEGVEPLWENHTDAPFALHLPGSSFDMLPAEPDPAAIGT